MFIPTRQNSNSESSAQLFNTILCKFFHQIQTHICTSMYGYHQLWRGFGPQGTNRRDTWRISLRSGTRGMVWKYLKKVEKNLLLILASSSFSAVSRQLDSRTNDDTMMMVTMNETKHVFCSFIVVCSDLEQETKLEIWNKGLEFKKLNVVLVDWKLGALKLCIYRGKLKPISPAEKSYDSRLQVIWITCAALPLGSFSRVFYFLTQFF